MLRRSLAIPLAASLALAPGVAAASGSSGDASTIAYYKAIATNTNAQRGVVLAQSGYMSLAVSGGRRPSISYLFGVAPLPSGYLAAAETITFAQASGAVAWLTDVLHAPGAPPVELLVTRSAAFAGIVTGPGSAVGCFQRVRFTSVPYRAGGPWWSALGHFRPLVAHGNQVLITVTYTWGDGRKVTETDSVDVARGLFTGSSLRVSAGGDLGHGAMGITQHVRFLAKTPAAPPVHLCGRA